MLNHQPIFIHALARGGSNIIMNMLLSHPGVCLSNGETHKVFKGTKWDSFWQVTKKKLIYDLPIRMATSQNLFNPYDYTDRTDIPEYIKRYIDRILYHGRFDAMIDTHNLYKYEGITYSHEELANCRLLTKGLGGLAFTTGMFAEMYPDAHFVGLVRNGLAVCEGYVRRGEKAERVGEMYAKVAGKIAASARKHSNYHLFFYEEMVSSPVTFMENLYQATGLDIAEVPKVRLQSKGVTQADGQRIHLKGSDRQVFWHNKPDLSQFIRSDINTNQINQLSEDNKNRFLDLAGGAMEDLGYAI